ncbi:hypothetical protein FGIG_11564, partial [Fasciola gigantica]
SSQNYFSSWFLRTTFIAASSRLLTDCGFGTPNFGSTADLANQFCSSGTSSAGSAPDDLDDSSRGLLNQHRALIFFQTREMLRLTEDMLKNQFPWLTSTRLDGSVPLNERYARVTRFNSDPSIDLMLLTTAVGGLGLNLTGADTVIFVEHDWNPSKDLQVCFVLLVCHSEKFLFLFQYPDLDDCVGNCLHVPHLMCICFCYVS